MRKKILITSALKMELKALIKLTGATCSSQNGNKYVYSGQLNDVEITLANFGLGGSFAKNFKQFSLADYQAAFLIGMAGGIKKSQHIGTPVFPENIVSINTKNINEVIHPSENLLYKLKTLRPEGTLLCSNKMLNYKEKSGLSGNIDFVDMESYAFGQHCLSSDIPFLIIKSLSDNLATQFPRLEFIKEKISEINFYRAFGYYLTRPLELVWLIKLYRNMNMAIRENARTTQTLLRDIFYP